MAVYILGGKEWGLGLQDSKTEKGRLQDSIILHPDPSSLSQKYAGYWSYDLERLIEVVSANENI